LYSEGKEKGFDMVSKEALDFMKEEFGLTREQILKLSDEEYEELFYKVLCIEADENVKCDGKPLSRRGKLAGEILSIMYFP
jgi:hypothetical protein